jgi:serine/threonine-protein kinase
VAAAPNSKAMSHDATAMLPSSGADQPLRIRGRYRVVKELGRGAMGVVYRAFDEQLEREVAIKALSEALRGHPEALKLFVSEAKALAQLHHPNLVALYDQISDNGEAYLVMEFVDGESLDRVLSRDGRYGWRDALLLTYHLCAGLAYAHGKNIIHRDIKPANIFIMPDGAPKLGDFGLARVMRELVIRSTEIRGTPLYMAPEQVKGTMIDHRADLYAVGCTLFELVTGRPPFIEGEILYLQMMAEPPKPSEFVGDLPAPVEQLMLSMLAKEAADRPASAQAVRDQIRAIVS